MNTSLKISVVIPVYNEAESVSPLHAEIVKVMESLGCSYEIIFVDDGSNDGTFEEIKKCKPMRGLRLSRNFGQTAAFGAGLAEVKGEIIVSMDGDLENQPADIGPLLQKLEEGYDVVCGWRKDRWVNEFFTRRLPSKMANALISRVTRVRLHDHGCNLRAYRKEVFKGVTMTGEMHRMLGAYLGMRGAKIAEIPVGFSPRKFGKSKYGLSRIFRVILDILAYHFFRTYASRPMHFFGYAGFISMFLGGLAFLWALYLRIFKAIHFNRTPLPELIAIFVVVGFQFILMGLLAEMFMRSQKKESNTSYEIKERVER